ncbi:hypothetical protein VPZ60_004227 [Salmonella enterica]|nr:hypothetical protein [Salmonella enterica]
MDIRNIKKRYIVGAIAIVVLLFKCTGSSEEERYQDARNERAAEDARYLANQDAISQGQPAPYAPAAGQPVIINQQPPTVIQSGGGHDGFLSGMLFGHLFSNHNSGPSYEPSRRTVTNVKNITNVKNVTQEQPKPKRFDGPANPTTRIKSNTWAQPSNTARSYNVQAPAPSSMKNSTWATTSKKGWGSSTSYKSKSTGFKSSSSARSRRRR